jgi:trimeric autotransporter adhesin
MNNEILKLKATTVFLRDSIIRSRLRSGFILPVLALGFASSALSPKAQATDLDPVLPNGNTADGSGVLINLTTGINNSGFGFLALFNNTSGSENTATGHSALQSNTTGNDNTATGFDALLVNTTGSRNTANGAGALNENTTGDSNTAVGAVALFNNTTGSDNTATGADALITNTIGSNNTASGSNALFHNTAGNNNTADGFQALFSNTTGINNTAHGHTALQNNTTGDNNTGVGVNALNSNTEGIDNTASGLNALFGNTSGSENTASGQSALQNNTTGNDNTAIGHDALFNNTTGGNNIAVGHGAGSNLTTGNNNIDIGFFGVAGEANTIRIGTQGTHTATYIAGISGIPLGSGVAVRVNANGQLGTVPSSARFKQNIKSMGDTSDALYALRPVTFGYKHELDPQGIQQFGLVAEDVEKVNPDLVGRDRDGKPYTVRYDAVNAMLLNEFLKEHRKVQELGTTVVQQQKQIETLTAGLHKVSAQIDLNNFATGRTRRGGPSRQMVLNNQ